MEFAAIGKGRVCESSLGLNGLLLIPVKLAGTPNPWISVSIGSKEARWKK